MRTAEARESALRAARMRRQAEREDMKVEEAKRRLENDKYQKRYKSAARKWVSSLIALPILLVTSYYLFDRCEQCLTFESHRERVHADGALAPVALGHAQKSMPKTPPPSAGYVDEKNA